MPKGFKHSPKTRLKMSLARLGRKHSDETKEKMRTTQLGERGHNWLGDDVTYIGLHTWTTRHFGRPKLCEHCGTTTAKKFHWANISRAYRRDRSDWLRLCASCHQKFDNMGRRNFISSLDGELRPCIASRAAFITGRVSCHKWASA
jgi:hypothetical protein